MRCRIKPEENYTFHRYRFVPQSGRVYYENGGVLEVFKDKMTYLGVTKFLDAWIPETRVLIEHKSRGVNLDAPQSGHGGLTPYEQAVE